MLNLFDDLVAKLVLESQILLPLVLGRKPVLFNMDTMRVWLGSAASLGCFTLNIHTLEAQLIYVTVLVYE